MMKQLFLGCFIMIICLINVGLCIDEGSKLKYADCSTTSRCQSCLNQYICDVCPNYIATYCCPKYCLACTGQKFCSKCQDGFILKTILSGYKICQNNNPSIDPNRNLSSATGCNTGYYFDKTLRFCQKSQVPNCKFYIDSITCYACQDGYEFKNGLCIFGNNLTKQEQADVYIFLLVLGILLGLCLACILVKLFTCSKKKIIRLCNCCKNLRQKIKNKIFRIKDDENLINQDNISAYDAEIPQINDDSSIKKQKSPIKIKQKKEKKDQQDLLNDIQKIKPQNKERKSTISDEQKQFASSNQIEKYQKQQLDEDQQLPKSDKKLKRSIITQASVSL